MLNVLMLKVLMLKVLMLKVLMLTVAIACLHRPSSAAGHLTATPANRRAGPASPTIRRC
jgi:hypothetical protein